MATKEHLRCLACGSQRPRGAFGINDKGTFEELPAYEANVAIQEIGGRGRCSWTFHDASVELCHAMREGLLAAVAGITADIRRVTGDWSYGKDDDNQE